MVKPIRLHHVMAVMVAALVQVQEQTHIQQQVLPLEAVQLILELVKMALLEQQATMGVLAAVAVAGSAALALVVIIMHLLLQVQEDQVMFIVVLKTQEEPSATILAMVGLVFHQHSNGEESIIRLKSFLDLLTHIYRRTRCPSALWRG